MMDGLIAVGILLSLSAFPIFTVAALVYHSIRKKELEVHDAVALQAWADARIEAEKAAGGDLVPVLP